MHHARVDLCLHELHHHAVLFDHHLAFKNGRNDRRLPVILSARQISYVRMGPRSERLEALLELLSCEQLSGQIHHDASVINTGRRDPQERLGPCSPIWG